MYIIIKEDPIYEEKKIFIPGIVGSSCHVTDAGIHAGGSQAGNGEVVKYQGC